MRLGVTLMITLCGIERFERINDRGDSTVKHFRGIELLDVGHGDLLLQLRSIKNPGPVLRTGIRALTIHLRRIVSNREKYFQELAKCNLRRIENDLDGLRVPGASRADFFVRRGIRRAAGITRRGANYPPDVLEHSLNS